MTARLEHREPDPDERHRRRMMLMRMQGDTNRLESRAHVWMIIAAVLAGIALILSVM